MTKCDVCGAEISDGDTVIIIGNHNDAILCTNNVEGKYVCYTEEIVRHAEDYAFQSVHGTPIPARVTEYYEGE